MSLWGVSRRKGILALVLVAATLLTPNASAQDREASSGEAGRHFRHGVQLYGEADYAGALVEFKRAFTIAPSSAALYNVGEAQYQLQDYAGALKTFQRFLNDFGPTESHRAEVERDVDVLRQRVGHLSITTLPVGADLTVDEQAIGRTPLGEPLLVSVGHRKVVASMAGRVPVTRYVDVAAEDNLSISLQLPASTEFAPAATARDYPTASVAAPQSHGSPLRAVGFIATGVLAAGAVTFGVLAVAESSTLKSARNAFPANGATINRDANLTTTFSILADSLAVAAIAVGGIALYATLSSSGDHAAATAVDAQSPPSDARRPSGPTSRVILGPASARFEMTF